MTAQTVLKMRAVVAENELGNGQLIAVKAQCLKFEPLINFKINAVTFGTLRFQK